MWIFFIISTRSPLTTPKLLPEGILSALSFLTRFGAQRHFGNPQTGFFWYWLVGLLIGLLCLGASEALLAALNGRKSDLLFLLGGMAWVGSEIWISGALHWDGLADLGDALGSRASGEKFSLILKDSRLGACGAITLFLFITFQALAASLQLSEADATHAARPILVLILAPLWARLTPFWLGFMQHSARRQSMGALVCNFTTLRVFAANLLFGAICIALAAFTGTPLLHIVVLCAAQVAILAWLRNKARLHGGLSGDFFGACIEISQTLFLICCISPAR